jgi:hypothetical protein
MSFGLKFVSIVSIAGVLAWAASAAPLQSSGNTQSQGAGYGYGAVKVTLCHIPPGNPANAHTITVGAPAVPAHLAHGDTLGPCPQTLAATASTGKKAKKSKDDVTVESATEEQSSPGKSKKQKPEKGVENASAGKPEKTKSNQGAGTQEKSNNGQSKKSESATVESGTTEQLSVAPVSEQKQKKPKKEKPAHSNGVGQLPAPTTDISSPGNGNGNGNGGGNGNAGGNGNGQGNGKNK